MENRLTKILFFKQINRTLFACKKKKKMKLDSKHDQLMTLATLQSSPPPQINDEKILDTHGSNKSLSW